MDSFRMGRRRRSVSETIVDRIHQMIQENGGERERERTTQRKRKEKEAGTHHIHNRRSSTVFDVIAFPPDLYITDCCFSSSSSSFFFLFFRPTSSWCISAEPQMLIAYPSFTKTTMATGCPARQFQIRNPVHLPFSENCLSLSLTLSLLPSLTLRLCGYVATLK